MKNFLMHFSKYGRAVVGAIGPILSVVVTELANVQHPSDEDIRKVAVKAIEAAINSRFPSSGWITHLVVEFVVAQTRAALAHHAKSE